MINHLVQFSTGASSAEVAWRVVHDIAKPGDNIVLLAADTLVEDDDNWRFGYEVANLLGLEITRLADGRTPMEVGRDARVVPNNRMAVCSRVLKRDLLRKYMEANFDPADSVVYLGFGWDEQFRMDKARPHWEPWTVDAPMMREPLIAGKGVLDLWRSRGIEPPRLYEQGFAHANCGGACVRGGQAQWELLLRVNPERYKEWEDEEEKTRQMLGKNVAILRQQRNNVKTPLTLRSFRERLDESPTLFDENQWGACGCTEDFSAPADEFDR